MLTNKYKFLWQVTQDKTWFADESVLAHFESLELEMVFSKG